MEELVIALILAVAAGGLVALILLLIGIRIGRGIESALARTTRAESEALSRGLWRHEQTLASLDEARANLRATVDDYDVMGRAG